MFRTFLDGQPPVGSDIGRTLDRSFPKVAPLVQSVLPRHWCCFWPTAPEERGRGGLVQLRRSSSQKTPSAVAMALGWLAVGDVASDAAVGVAGRPGGGVSGELAVTGCRLVSRTTAAPPPPLSSPLRPAVPPRRSGQTACRPPPPARVDSRTQHTSGTANSGRWTQDSRQREVDRGQMTEDSGQRAEGAADRGQRI